MEADRVAPHCIAGYRVPTIWSRSECDRLARAVWPCGFETALPTQQRAMIRWQTGQGCQHKHNSDLSQTCACNKGASAFDPRRQWRIFYPLSWQIRAFHDGMNAETLLLHARVQPVLQGGLGSGEGDNGPDCHEWSLRLLTTQPAYWHADSFPLWRLDARARTHSMHLRSRDLSASRPK